jgi:hypothetical protein
MGVDGRGVGRSTVTIALPAALPIPAATAGGPAVTPSPSDTVATATLEASAAPRDRDGRSFATRPYRIGSSIQRRLASASTNVSASSPRRAGDGRALPTAAAGRTSSGQCQRYSEYEIPPTQRIGRIDTSVIRG